MFSAFLRVLRVTAFHFELDQHVYKGNELAAQDIIAFGAERAVIATGHRYARELGEPAGGDVAFRRERTAA